MQCATAIRCSKCSTAVCLHEASHLTCHGSYHILSRGGATVIVTVVDRRFRRRRRRVATRRKVALVVFT